MRTRGDEQGIGTTSLLAMTLEPSPQMIIGAKPWDSTTTTRGLRSTALQFPSIDRQTPIQRPSQYIEGLHVVNRQERRVCELLVAIRNDGGGACLLASLS